VSFYYDIQPLFISRAASLHLAQQNFIYIPFNTGGVKKLTMDESRAMSFPTWS